MNEDSLFYLSVVGGAVTGILLVVFVILIIMYRKILTNDKSLKLDEMQATVGDVRVRGANNALMMENLTNAISNDNYNATLDNRANAIYNNDVNDVNVRDGERMVSIDLNGGESYSTVKSTQSYADAVPAEYSQVFSNSTKQKNSKRKPAIPDDTYSHTVSPTNVEDRKDPTYSSTYSDFK